MRSHCYVNDFGVQENETACTTHFHMKGFTLTITIKVVDVLETFCREFCN